MTSPELPRATSGPRRAVMSNGNNPRALPPLPVKEGEGDIPLTSVRKKKKKNVNTKSERFTEKTGSNSEKESEIPASVVQKKKKKQAHVTGNGETFSYSMEQNTPGLPEDEKVTRKPKKRTKKNQQRDQVHYESDLPVEEEDVVTRDAVVLGPSEAPLFVLPTSTSQPFSKVFVERKSGFQAAERQQLGVRQAALSPTNEFLTSRPLPSPRDVALRVQKGFRVVSLFAHGVLAGFALWNTVLVYVLWQKNSLPGQYEPLAIPAQELAYLLLVLSTISAFDRVDLARPQVFLRGLITLDSAAWASVVYFSALVLSLSMTKSSHKLASQSDWSFQDESPWIILNMIVSVMVVFGWLILSLSPTSDHSTENMFGMELGLEDSTHRHPTGEA
ncbi:transmembrane protein 237-like [Lethenteron reissneri]|uniref:transmembrane protein 237-like n=1 Tax=Lethenteron reissneri TaxID=7753 RepID=UPI002AB6961D|nr:transmembrane protein 237-like [Lethenteron reissneri]